VGWGVKVNKAFMKSHQALNKLVYSYPSIEGYLPAMGQSTITESSHHAELLPRNKPDSQELCLIPVRGILSNRQSFLKIKET
jgi:hypothetical protein